MERPLLEPNIDTFIRFNEAIGIFRKISQHNEPAFKQIISSAKPFGLRTFFEGKDKEFKGSIKIYTNRGVGYIPENEILQNVSWVKEHKVYISYAYGERGAFPYLVIGKPFIGEPNSCCTETYLVIGPFREEEKCQNVVSYMTTKFFRFLVLLKKNTQHATRNAYSFAPIQDFNEPWTDEKLYKKYELTQEEIDFIESMIRPMELANE
jgi:site-specific DNA-methyltransferase (adenine-specific)